MRYSVAALTVWMMGVALAAPVQAGRNEYREFIEQVPDGYFPEQPVNVPVSDQTIAYEAALSGPFYLGRAFQFGNGSTIQLLVSGRKDDLKAAEAFNEALTQAGEDANWEVQQVEIEGQSFPAQWYLYENRAILFIPLHPELVLKAVAEKQAAFEQVATFLSGVKLTELKQATKPEAIEHVLK